MAKILRNTVTHSIKKVDIAELGIPNHNRANRPTGDADERMFSEATTDRDGLIDSKYETLALRIETLEYQLKQLTDVISSAMANQENGSSS